MFDAISGGSKKNLIRGPNKTIYQSRRHL